MHYLISRKHSTLMTGDYIHLTRSKRIIKILTAPKTSDPRSNAKGICHYWVQDFNMDPRGEMENFSARFCDMITDVFKMIRVEEGKGGEVSNEGNSLARRLVMDAEDLKHGSRFYFTTDKAKIRLDIFRARNEDAPYYLTNECPKYDEQNRPIGPYTLNWWNATRSFTLTEALKRINAANPKILQRA